MILVGVDIEDISRFENKSPENDSEFLLKIFTQNELDYCFKQKKYAQSLAARFCAKEAVVKALGSEFKEHISYNEIEILKKANGAPYINILKKGKFSNFSYSLSISHEKQKAVAFVVVT